MLKTRFTKIKFIRTDILQTRYLCIAIIGLLIMNGCSVDARLTKADTIYKDGQYYKAEKKYRKIVRRISKKKKNKRSDVYFKIAECNRLLFNMKKAEIYYKRAIKYDYSDSTVFLNMAKAEMANAHYKEAAKNYEKFLQFAPTNKEALDGLISAEHAKELLKRPSPYKVGIANDFNNKKSCDFSPFIVDSEASMIAFTSNRNVSKKQKKSNITGQLNYDIYIAAKNRMGKWEKPKYISELNISEDDGVCSFTSDGKSIFFTRTLPTQGDSASSYIMVSSRRGGEWTMPEMVQLFKDTTIMVAHPAISPDGNVLYFVSDDTLSTIGGKDIYYSNRKDNGWGPPINLGDKINTTGNEMFPYVSHNGDLYFASDGHQGFGGLDIFKATKDSNDIWQVDNMLAPINSPQDDFGITFKAESNSGYFSSNRSNSKHLDNIYWFDLPEVTYFIEGKVFDENKETLDAIVKIIGNDGSIIKQRVKKDGSYRVKLNKNVNYVMLASNRGHLNSSHKISTIGETTSKNFTKNFTLPSIYKPVKMNNIFYEFGSWQLSEESKTGLDELVKLLTDNPNITIEVSAHTDSVGSDESNINLSQKRANSVIDYLIKAGIVKERLQSKGYGESKPVIVDVYIAKQYNFLKEGDELTPAFIATLKESQKEICNQINRRTEFRVLRTNYNLY